MRRSDDMKRFGRADEREQRRNKMFLQKSSEVKILQSSRLHLPRRRLLHTSKASIQVIQMALNKGTRKFAQVLVRLKNNSEKAYDGSTLLPRKKKRVAVSRCDVKLSHDRATIIPQKVIVSHYNVKV